ncbi:Hydroxyacyl-thioester dehydratase type 2, mitochondrial [Neolecta irregularis DAH-3]|uniref:Hydroxyacyl-thioester dehydratase type 2, mitochondrial n=1 Tax=Neolecta irregularis (strain DAH-3) TaxID=1198029 RepID=A0A1U7LNT8_NEOID|nr:Hydroxyacyl-thioester dehydratase type 2, mitochondrial [Neolecta irregularis DAH-3]|eukprot:OLL24299.1 Hydroxyacyl-thioester dehydratase type 2, mitochondrial [Neolecta irregularis DAH-3]
MRSHFYKSIHAYTTKAALISKPPQKTFDYLSPTTTYLLETSLATHLALSPLSYHIDSPLPPGYHLLYFPSPDLEQALSKDGYSSYFAPEGYNRRLWIGGSIEFSKEPIRLGNMANCTEVVERIIERKNKAMVWTSRNIKQGEAWITEERGLYYSNEKYHATQPLKISDMKDFENVVHFTPTQILLSRFAGLSFNAHKIHVDADYAKLEGYPTTLLPGPLSIIILCSRNPQPYRRLVYQCIAPCFMGMHL